MKTRLDFGMAARAMLRVLLAAAFVGVLAGCGREAENASEAPARLEKTYERGPVRLDVRTSASTISTAETLELTLSATLEDGYSVEFPAYPEPAEPAAAAADAPAIEARPEFTPSGYEDAAPALNEDQRVTRSRTYRLEPFLEGDYTIPALAVSHWKEVEGEDQKSTLETEALSITVTPVIGANEAPEIKDIAGPVGVRDPFPWVKFAVIALLLAALAGAAYWYWFVRVLPPPAACRARAAARARAGSAGSPAA